MLTFDFTITLKDILELLVITATLGGLYFRVIRKVAGIQSAAENLTNFHKTVKTELESVKTAMLADLNKFKGEIGASLASMLTTTSSLERRLAEADQNFVRKDVHNAHLALINERLKPLERLEKLVDKFFTQPRPRKIRRAP